MAYKLFALAMILVFAAFAVVQINDPDGLTWAAIYSIPMFSGFIAFFAPYQALKAGVKVILFIASLGFLIGSVNLLSFTTASFANEVFRESMGVLLAGLCLLGQVLWEPRKPRKHRQWL
jgi:peptidoglycan/LPS O-acetylase OafA/YrhL